MEQNQTFTKEKIHMVKKLEKVLTIPGHKSKPHDDSSSFPQELLPSKYHQQQLWVRMWGKRNTQTLLGGM
jgi:hypothetical protein